MSRADEIFAQNMQDIMENGFWDTDLNVRPKWEDGTPAHTVKKFGIVNRYIETLWYLLKKIYDKGLLYKGKSIQHHCVQQLNLFIQHL